MSEVILSVSGLTIAYDREPVVEEVSFEVHPGRLIGIVGPNGAGKSTMIKAMVGALRAQRGEVLVRGVSGRKAQRQLTYVPQRGSVDWDFPVTVYDVVKQGRYGDLGLLGRMKQSDRDIIEDALTKVGMQAFSGRQIGELSGGQQQRVFLARALCQRGEIYVLDEPFTGVDARTEAAIVEVLRELRAGGASALVVHHDLATVGEYFDEVLLMNREIIAFGPTREVFTQENLQRAYGGKLAIFGAGEMAVMG